MSTATADIYDAPQSDLGVEIPTEQSGLFGFKGRLSVLGYMSRSALLILGMAVIGLGFYFSMGDVLGNLTAIESGASGAGFSLLLIGVFVLMVVPLGWIGLALMAKRLHDINMSGWWILVGMIPIVGMIFTLFVSLKPGQSEGNRFGQANPAEGWEKPVGILGIVLTVGMVVGSVAIDGMALLGMG